MSSFTVYARAWFPNGHAELWASLWCALCGAQCLGITECCGRKPCASHQSGAEGCKPSRYTRCRALKMNWGCWWLLGYADSVLYISISLFVDLSRKDFKANGNYTCLNYDHCKLMALSKPRSPVAFWGLGIGLFLKSLSSPVGNVSFQI